MDAPPIQYCRTDDGVNIAYWMIGTGPTVVISHYFALSNLDREWELPALRAWYEELARDFTVVRYTPRGTGQSDRGGNRPSIANFVLDLDAVVRATGRNEIALMSSFWGVRTALDYAAQHADVVSRLVLFEPYEPGESWGSATLTSSVQTISDELGFNIPALVASVNMAPDGTEKLESLVDLVHESYSFDTAGEFLRTIAEANLSAVLPRIAVETLVIGRRNRPNIRWGGMTQVAETVAATIPSSRLIMVDGSGTQPYFQHGSVILDHVRSFLWQAGDPDEVAEAGAPSGFRTLLFTDLESSTALTQALGDAKAQEILHGHNDAVRAALAAHDGEEVKHTGDGIFAAFGSAVSAVEAALQIQRDLAGAEVRVRIGLNAGEPIAEDHDYFGTAVQLAARVCDRAEPGQVLVSNVVRSYARARPSPSPTRAKPPSRASLSPCGCLSCRMRAQ